MDSVAEIWKAIPGYEGFYEVSNFGAVRGVERIINKPFRGVPHRAVRRQKLLLPTLELGYPCVTLSKCAKTKRFAIHQLVALAFIGPRPAGDMTVNHINGNKQDNRPVNLEYLTRGENTLHSFRTGLQDRHQIQNCRVVLTEDCVRKIRLNPQIKVKEMAADIGCSESTVRKVRQRRSWKHVTVE